MHSILLYDTNGRYCISLIEYFLHIVHPSLCFFIQTWGELSLRSALTFSTTVLKKVDEDFWIRETPKSFKRGIMKGKHPEEEKWGKLIIIVEKHTNQSMQTNKGGMEKQ